MNSQTLNTIQVALTFINGFLVSRLLIKCGLAEKTVFFFMKKSGGHLSRILIYLTFSTALLSVFIPNVIALLAILPLLQILKKDFEALPADQKSLDTALSLSSLYGANIGGTGSIIGSPSNLILMGFLLVRGVSGYEQLNFVSWMGWGIPLVALYSLLACFLVSFLLVPKSIRKLKINFNALHHHQAHYPHEKAGIILSLATLIFFTLLPLLNLIFEKSMMPLTTLLAILYTLLFIILLFFIPLHDKKNRIQSKILTLKDCYTNLPGRGFLIAGAAVAFSSLMIFLGIDAYLSKWVSLILPQGVHPFWVMLVFTLMVVFTSEFISNTATAVSFFVVAFPVAEALNLSPLPFLLGISLVSTIPSMSPVASPVNAMAFGGIRGVSLKKMMLAGFFMDLIGALLISLLAIYLLPHYYRLS